MALQVDPVHEPATRLRFHRVAGPVRFGHQDDLRCPVPRGTLVVVHEPEEPENVRTRYAGKTADHYLRLSEAGLAPRVFDVTEDEIVAGRHQTLAKWLAAHPGEQARAEMNGQLKRLPMRVHHEVQLCHRDVHRDNVVVDREGQSSLIDPAYATEAMNERCYDLQGPGPSTVAVPEDHLQQGGLTADGIWWGSPQKFRSLETAVGLSACES